MAPEASAVGIGVRAAEKGGPIDWVGIYVKIRRWKAQDREVALDRRKHAAQAMLHRERLDSPVSWDEDSGVGIKMDWVDHFKDNKAVDYSGEGRFWWQSSNAKRLRRVKDAGAMDAELRKCTRRFLYDKIMLGSPQRPLPRILARNPIYGCTTTLGTGSGGLPAASPQSARTRQQRSQDRQSSRGPLRCKGGRV